MLIVADTVKSNSVKAITGSCGPGLRQVLPTGVNRAVAESVADIG